MTKDEIYTHCLSLPKATHVEQWMGSQVYKIGGKVFAIHAPESGHVTFKCDTEDTAKLLIEVGAAKRAPHLPRGGWVAVPPDMDADELKARISQSYQTVLSGLSKAVRKEIEGGAE